MKKAELTQLIFQAIDDSGYLPEEHSRNLAEHVVNKIANSLIVQKVEVLNGSIDESPDSSHYSVDEFIKESTEEGFNDFRKMEKGETISDYYSAYHDDYYDEDNCSEDGSFADYFGIVTFNLIED